MGDAAVERPAQDGPLGLQRHVVAEVVPQPERDGREVEAAAPAAGGRSGRRRRCRSGRVGEVGHGHPARSIRAAWCQRVWRSARGVVPTSRVKCRCRWAWSWKPTAVATAAIGLAGQQPAAGGLDPAAGEVAVRRQPERGGEAAHQVRRVGVQDVRGGAQGEPGRPGARRAGRAGRAASRGGSGAGRPGRPAGAAGSGRRSAPAGSRPPAPRRARQRAVQLVDPVAQQRVVQARAGDRGPGQARVEHVGVEVEHPLAEPVRRWPRGRCARRAAGSRVTAGRSAPCSCRSGRSGPRPRRRPAASTCRARAPGRRGR